MDRPDLTRSRALLIGNGTYADPRIPDLPGAVAGVEAMSRLLTGPLCGWPASRITALADVPGRGELAVSVVDAMEDVEDVLLVYYVGHGMQTFEGQLALALGETRLRPETLPHTSMLYRDLASILRGCRAPTKLVILDCCHAGLGDRANYVFQSADMAEAYPVDGLYFIGASDQGAKAKAPVGGGLTYFTEALIATVSAGIPGQPAMLRLDQIFLELRTRLLRANRPEPVESGVRGARQFPFARNAAPPESFVLDSDAELRHLRRQMAQAEEREHALRVEHAREMQQLLRQRGGQVPAAKHLHVPKSIRALPSHKPWLQAGLSQYPAGPGTETNVRKDQLGPLTFIAQSSEGQVYRMPEPKIRGLDGLVAYKEIQPSAQEPDRAQIVHTVEAAVKLRGNLEPADRAALEGMTTWPFATVQDHGVVTGTLMPLLPAEYFVTITRNGQPHPTPFALSFLSVPESYIEKMGIDRHPADDVLVRMALAAQLAFAIGLLHKYDIVYGDLSLQNVAVALDGETPKLMLLDCDSVASVHDSQRKQFHSPGFAPPECKSGSQGTQDLKTDIYKLGLCVLRMLMTGRGVTQLRDPNALRSILDREGVGLIGRTQSADRTLRPTATDICSYFEKTVKSRAGVSGSGEVVAALGDVEGQLVMPFYILCDVSGSMYSDVADLHRAVADLINDLMSNPVADQLAMVSVITFDSSARTVVPLDAPSAIELPTLVAGGGTNYGAAFREYHRAFEADRARLKAEGKKVYRPCVFFIAGSAPEDSDYLQTFRSLLSYDLETRLGNKAFPYVVTIGFEEVPQKAMRELAYPDFGKSKGRWFMAGVNSVGQILKSMTGTIGITDLSS